MDIRIGTAPDPAAVEGLEALLREYLGWVVPRLSALAGEPIDTAAYLANTLGSLDLCRPPAGRLVLARVDGALAGMGFLKPLAGDACEVKRLYVRPEHRGLGLGRAILAELVAEARAIGHGRMLLDSTGFMGEALGLYRAAGFRERGHYAGAETDARFADRMIYLELGL